MDGQLDILDALRFDDRAAKKLTRTQSDVHQLPEDVWRQNVGKASDYWHTVVPCSACGIPASRYGLAIDHGVHFDKTSGQQVLPGGPGMRDHGICMLMSKTRDDAVAAGHIMAGTRPHDHSPTFPPPSEWWVCCYAHEHRKKKCPDSCWDNHHRHLTRMADRVWGSDQWRDTDR